MIKENFNNIQEIWENFEKCRNEDDIKSLIEDIPQKFGNFSYEILDNKSFRIINDYYESDELNFDSTDFDFLLEEKIKKETNKIVKENYELIENDLNELEHYTKYDIADMLEISYMLGQREKLEKLNEVFEIASDGINTYGLFVKFVFDKFSKSTVESIDYALDNLDETIQEFIKKYYYKKEENKKQQLYICTNDFQGGNFGIGRVGTIDDWREIALSWSNTEGLEESVRTTPNNELIDFIQEMWEIEIEEYDRNKEYDLYCNYTHGNGLFFEENAKEILKVLSNAKYDLQNLILCKENLNSIFISKNNIEIKNKLISEIDKKVEEIIEKNNISFDEYEKITEGVKREVVNNKHLLDLGKDRLNNIFENCSYKEIAETLFSFNYNKQEVIDTICDGETDKEAIKEITDIVENIENDSEEENI